MANSGISVALCTYNGSKYILEQLESIFSQTLLPDEIVISDDGSIDGTVGLIEDFLKDSIFPNPEFTGVKVKIYKNTTPMGVTKNFESALIKCTHPLIALSDQDDYWFPSKLQALADLFVSNEKLLLAFTDSLLVDSLRNPLGYSSFDALGVSKREKELFRCGLGYEVLVKRNLATGATVMLRKKLLEISTPFPESWVHDEWLALVASFSDGIQLVEESFIEYRQHGTNQIGMKKPGLRHYIGRLIFPRTERNVRLYNRAESMCKHTFFASKEGIAKVMAEEKLQHEIARKEFPPKRISRIKPVISEMRTGRYGQYGLGFQDIARDLIQPV